MGYPKDSTIDVNQPLTELGMDSLMAVRIRNTVRGDFGVEPPVALLLQGASLAALTTDLVRQLGLDAEEKADSSNAVRTWESCQATPNQCSEKPEIGQLSMFDRLNAYSTIAAIGTNRNRSTSATQIRSAKRRPLGST